MQNILEDIAFILCIRVLLFMDISWPHLEMGRVTYSVGMNAKYAMRECEKLYRSFIKRLKNQAHIACFAFHPTKLLCDDLFKL